MLAIWDQMKERKKKKKKMNLNKMNNNEQFRIENLFIFSRDEKAECFSSRTRLNEFNVTCYYVWTFAAHDSMCCCRLLLLTFLFLLQANKHHITSHHKMMFWMSEFSLDCSLARKTSCLLYLICVVCFLFSFVLEFFFISENGPGDWLIRQSHR